MLCPKCKKEMIVVERNQVELDYCMYCEGFWFDNAEWNILSKKLISENLLNKDNDIYDIPPVLTGEKPRKCPVCNRKMEKFMLFDVLLDRCKNKHGVWFDKNEFSSVVNSVSKNADKEHIKFLGEVFNR